MPTITITEGLAEVKTINARIVKKREAILQHLARDARLKDPYAADGGSGEFVKRERQAISDLEGRIVAIRCAIQAKNLATSVTIGTTTKTLAAWLNWRREVSQKSKEFLGVLSRTIAGIKQEAGKQQMRVTATETGQPSEIVINLDEPQLARDVEGIEEVLGNLDGKLSLLNATTTIEV